MSKDWNGELRACRDGADVMINSATDNVAMVYHKHGEDRLSRASYIVHCVNAAPAKEARIAELEAAIRSATSRIEACGVGGVFENIRAELDAALKGGE